ncbi:hypothetical protein K493DRAFT_284398 [Basidiobolus meristosporus CBS 931.73]|uniref:Oxidized purine nucleoside triphosphate hydrolase n=1 Tax=Basidiobolus meristosporus CBS 931.73 TaxID=1314790 RepID=A0A1Y1Y6Y7_9FUNG|nr:hypothetical protein K493DRAFT_284398 [Basidiobolus meristosporus CBS 931.73]|eukprot:ORX93781.1 hypothetical protein K493DRAFT_284398 [Basidiobolus meristosporus CBS 931.73]
MTVTSSKKVLTLIVIRDKEQNKVLLGMKKRGFGKGRWNGFGGKVEKGETIDEGALRELEEEAGITTSTLSKAGIIWFKFVDDPVLLEVHLFCANSYEGDVTETEEMRPQWYDIDSIPFDDMWPDDRYWFPYLLQEQKFVGKILFKEDQTTIVSQNIHVVDILPNPTPEEIPDF